MNEDKQSNQPGQTGSTVGKGSAGERLDQFISGAKQFSNVAGRKAREMADSAVPKIKEIGDAATEQAQRAFKGQRPGGGSAVQTALAFYNGGGKKRKQLILIGGGAFILLMIILIPILIVVSPNSAGSAGTGTHSGAFSSDDYDKISIGMTKVQVETVLGKSTTTIAETASTWGSSTWGNSATDPTILMINFREGKVHSKSLINSEVAKAEQAIVDLGDRYAMGDQAVWKKAREFRNVGWQAADQVIENASPEMQAAYQVWRSASIASPTKYEVAKAKS